MKKRHHDLETWRQGILLFREIYSVTSDFPKEELFGLTSPMRRAAISVPSPIAEGTARSGKRELIPFLMVARGSL